MIKESLPTTSKRLLLKRVLAIDPTHRGFGFAVLEGPDRLIDWGLKCVRNDKQDRCLRKLAQLFDIHQPSVVAAEDVAAKGSRRCMRVRRLLAALQSLARARGIRFQPISAAKVRRQFYIEGASRKYDIAVLIAGRFSELRPILPRKHNYCVSHERMAVFASASLGLAAVIPSAPDKTAQ